MEVARKFKTVEPRSLVGAAFHALSLFYCRSRISIKLRVYALEIHP